MVKKIIIIIFLFYILILIQTSFLAHFMVRGVAPNFVLISVFLINLFVPSRDYSGLMAAAIGGFFLDVFSAEIFGFFGFYTLISLVMSFFLNFVFKKYVKIPAI